MDVYGDSQTIVTIWLTIMPKLSILILLLELYLQIDNFEGYFIIFNPLMDFIFNTSLFFKNITDYFYQWGGATLYEVNNNIGNISVNKLIDTGVRFNIDQNLAYISDLITTHTNAAPLSTHILMLGSMWKEGVGGGSTALYNLLFVCSLLSLIIGTVLGLAQSQIKRLMAWKYLRNITVGLNIKLRRHTKAYSTKL